MTIPKLDVGVSPGFLDVSYQLYRGLEGSTFDAIVFPDRGGHAYCAARARQLGAAFATTRIVVRCSGSTLDRAMQDGRAFLRKSEVGTIAVERVAVRLADTVVCDDDGILRAMRDHGWVLPAAAFSLGTTGESRSHSVWTEALVLPHSVPNQAAHTTGASLSVVITHYERPELLLMCLGGLASQSCQPLEVIVSDDGSRGAAIRDALMSIEARTWPWPLMILRLPHQGVHEARNAGWRAASGELVLFIDDDDVPFSSLVEVVLRSRRVSGADVICAGSRTFRGDGVPVARSGDVISLKLGEPHEMGLLSNHYGGPTCLWPRSLLERLQGFRDASALAEDWDILVRAALGRAQIAGTPDPLFWNRQLPGSREHQSGLARRNRTLATVAGYFAAELPQEFSMLPLLTTGAYEELERRKRGVTSRRDRVVRRVRALVAHARQVLRDEGTLVLIRRIRAFLSRRT